MNLTAERLNLGLAPAEVAERIGISRGSVVRAERGGHVSPKIAKAIADFYGVKVTDIWPVDDEVAA